MMMHYIWKCILICLCCIQIVSAQTKVTGRITDDTRNVVSNCSVLLRSGDDLLKFTATDEDGLFSFSLPTDAEVDGYVLETNHLSYISQTRALESGVLHYEFTLVGKSNQIDEVRIGRQPIQQRTDTLRFDVAFFADLADQSIGEVLRNMPGIEVNEQGRISYNGQPISDFYIDGDDLMGNRYGMATKVVPHEMIHAIEVIRNHQKIRALEDKVFSDNVALNLVTREDRRLDLSGQANLGGGWPAQYDGHINAILFNSKIKMLHSLTANNAGTDLMNQMRDLVDLSEPPIGSETILSTGTIRVHPGDFGSFYANQSANLLSNIMFDLSGDWKARGNIGFYVDKLSMDAQEQTRYFSVNQMYETFERTSAELKPIEAQVGLHISKNIKEQYVTNNLSALFRGHATSNHIQTLQANFLGTLQQHFWRIRNDFHFIPTPRGRNTWHYRFSIQTRRTPESLMFSPTELIHVLDDIRNGSYAVGQDFTHSQHRASAAISYLVDSRKPWFRQNYSLETYMGQERVQSGLWMDDHIPVSDTSFINEMDWKQYQLQLSANYSFHFEQLLIQTKLPISWHNIYWLDTYHDFSAPFRKLQIMPSFNLRYALSARQNLEATYYRLQHTGKVWDVYRGAVLTDYRTTRHSRSELPYVLRDLVEVNYGIESVAQMLFARIGYWHGSTRSNSMDARNLNNEQTELGSINRMHRVYSHAANASISKFVRILNGKIAVVTEIEQHHANQLFNDVTLRTRTQVLSVQPSLNAELFRNFKITYEGEFLWSGTSAFGFSDQVERSSSSSNRLEGVYSMGNAWHFKAIARHFHVGMDDFNYSQLMLDGNIRYQSPRTKLKYECVLVNLTNVQDLQYSLVNENYHLQKFQHQRGRMVLLKIGFDF